MRLLLLLTLGTAALLVVWMPLPARAEEATLPDGRRLTGKLVLTTAGRLQLTTPESRSPLPLAETHRLRFAESSLPPLLTAPVHRVLLREGQAITGELLGLDERKVRLRTPWTRELSLPCPSILGVSLVQTVKPLPRPLVDPTQDEVWLLGGDQLFGRLTRADGRTVTLEGRFGKRELTWGEVRGVFPRRQAEPPATTEGEHVRVRCDSGAASDPDELVGVVSALDDSQLTLRHPLLGEMKIERGRLCEMRWLFYGRRIEVDNGAHHLGDRDRLMAGLQPARAEGPSLRWTVRLEAAPDAAYFVVQVLQLKGRGDGIGPALERGEGRTELLVNGQRVDYLNRHVDRASPEPRRLRLALPARILRAGENVLELRQTPGHDSERHEDCGIWGLSLELPR
jgi:hypothetical protein